MSVFILPAVENYHTVRCQVQNLTPQLVNAGTIKMTYPENKVAMIMVMLMVVVMMLMVVFFEDHKNDSIAKISVPNGDGQS